LVPALAKSFGLAKLRGATLFLCPRSRYSKVAATVIGVVQLLQRHVAIMVRIKHRYLLFNILYPADAPAVVKSDDPPYLAFHTPSPPHLNGGLLLSTLRASIATHFGDVGVGLASTSLKVVYFSPATSTAIVRCPRQHFRLVWAAMTYMTEVPGPRGSPSITCVVQVVRVSGTIKKSEEELMRRSRRDIIRAKQWEASAGKSTDVLARLMDKSIFVPNTPNAAGDDIVDLDEEDDLSE
jgi:ribonuclease P/MRP protein subunit POP5